VLAKEPEPEEEQEGESEQEAEAEALTEEQAGQMKVCELKVCGAESGGRSEESSACSFSGT
jgi:hypothetical protein